MTSDSSAEDWTVPCSDEELEQELEDTPNGARPRRPSELQAWHQAVVEARAGGRGLAWSAPYGRRPPTPQREEGGSEGGAEEGQDQSNVDTSGFDFSDDSGSAPVPVPRRAAARGAVRRRAPTSFDSIVAEVRTQRREARERR